MEMEKHSSMYVKEKKHTLSRLWFVILISLVGFLIIAVLDTQTQRQFFVLRLLLLMLSLFSFFYYIFLFKFPSLLVRTRKFALIIVDISVLTIAIILLGSSGLFLLPLYLLIVMESGVSFGFVYFYFSLILSSFSWIILIAYSPYWKIHSDTVAIFAITTFLIPLVYMKQMMTMHKKNDTLYAKLESTTHAANYDVLTKLPNRKHYNSFMKNLLKEKQFFALLFIDLNKFKNINDTYGHQVGDEVLKEVAKRLNQSIEKDDMLARLGGDEFVVITRRKKVFLKKFLDNIEATTVGEHRVGRYIVLIELSIGISLFPDDSKSETFLRKYADEAMYCAKKRTDTYHVFYEELKASDNFC